MSERGIIFSSAMVQALLAGRKTQTRRLASSPLANILTGSTLYVRETVRAIELEDGTDEIEFAAGGTKPIENSAAGGERWSELAHYGGKGRRFSKRDAGGVAGPWVPAIHMPKWSSRLWLDLLGSRIEPLQEISKADAVAEGIELEGGAADRWRDYRNPAGAGFWSPILSYASLWVSLHGAGSWESNPDVLALSFRVEER